MASLNMVQLIGNIGADPDLYQFPDGEKSVTVSLATNEYFKDSKGESFEHTEWHRVTLRKRLAEVMVDWGKKGRSIYVQGVLRTRKYDKDGVTHYATEVRARRLEFLDKPPTTKADGSAGEQPRGVQEVVDELEADEIPF